MSTKREAKKMGRSVETYYCKKLGIVTTSHEVMTMHLWENFVETFRPEEVQE